LNHKGHEGHKEDKRQWASAEEAVLFLPHWRLVFFVSFVPFVVQNAFAFKGKDPRAAVAHLDARLSRR
jgi:hypothetical protein